MLGDNIQNIIQNYKGISDFDDFFEKIKNDLADNYLSVLVTLSLFANPIPEDLLNTISQDHNTNEQCQDNTSTSIVEIIQTLENKLLIKSERSKNENGAMIFSLSGVIKTAIENEKNRNPGKYKAIYDRWINYYNDFSYKNAESQSLKSEIKNIERVLAYCEEKKLWDNYYILSQNMSNYYLQNDYRTGKDSILYKRYFAAQNVSKKIPKRRLAIFYSLLDYCHYTYVHAYIIASGNMENKDKYYKSGLLDSINQDFSILERLYKKYRLFIPKQKKLVFYKTKVLNIFFTGKSKGATAAYKKWESLVFQTAAFEINQKE